MSRVARRLRVGDVTLAAPLSGWPVVDGKDEQVVPITRATG